jgi:protein-tyrosine phosphatase
MFSKLFNRKKREQDIYDDLPVPENANWSFLGADMHSHFIPGIDDGAPDVEASLTLVRAMVAMGYKTIITTPHVMVDYYPNTAATIKAGLQKLQDALKQDNIDIPVRAAAEYYIDEYFIKLLDTEPLLTIYQNEVLVEFSMMYEPPMLFDVIFKMQSAGYRPIIAHPERYLFFHNDFKRYRDLKDKGCLMQMNMLAVCGYYGRNIKAIADELLAKGIYDYCGSDMHHERHATALKAMAGTKDYHTIIGYPFLNSRLISPGQ